MYCRLIFNGVFQENGIIKYFLKYFFLEYFAIFSYMCYIRVNYKGLCDDIMNVETGKFIFFSKE